MAFIESIGSEFLPVGPYFFEYFFFMSVFLAARNEKGLQRIQFIFQFFTHRFTQSVGLTACEIGEQTGEQHDLFLIYRNSVSIFQILFHNRNIVHDRFFPMLAGDELRYVFHRSRTIKSVHGDEVFERRGMQLPQIFLHTGGLELECSGRPSGTV